MRIIKATWPIWVALWGALLPSFFLPHIDYYLYLHTGVEIVGIYGEAALLYLPLVLAISLVVAVASLAIGALARSEHLTCARAISVWVARLLVTAAACGLANSWLKSIGLSHSLGLSNKFLVLCVSALGAAILTWRNSKPGRVLRNLSFVALLAVPAVLVALLSFPLFVNSAGKTAGPFRSDSPRDIVLITIDALSAMHMSVYGYDRETTPNLKRFASKATVFDRFYADGNWTQAGIASLLSGLRPWTARSDNPGIGPATQSMSGNLLKIAHEAGYEVLTVSTNVNASPYRQKVDRQTDDEPPRLSRRLQTLRGWSHEHSDEILSRGTGASGSDGAGAPAGACLAVGGDQFDRRQDWMHGGDAAPLGAAG